jgi:hypothetical protein
VVQRHEGLWLHLASGRWEGRFHPNHRDQAAGLKGLNDGQKVSYEVAMERGKAAATNLNLRN